MQIRQNLILRNSKYVYFDFSEILMFFGNSKNDDSTESGIGLFGASGKFFFKPLKIKN